MQRGASLICCSGKEVGKGRQTSSSKKELSLIILTTEGLMSFQSFLPPGKFPSLVFWATAPRVLTRVAETMAKKKEAMIKKRMLDLKVEKKREW